MAESTIALVLAVSATAVNALAAAFGGWRWWQVEPSGSFWIMVRTGQAAALLQALGAGALAALGYEPAGGLYWLYALLPILIGFFAEQLRLSAAVQVLDARGLPDARAVGTLPEAEQRSVVLSIVRREMGVMALAAGVVAFLAVRAVALV